MKSENRLWGRFCRSFPAATQGALVITGSETGAMDCFELSPALLLEAGSPAMVVIHMPNYEQR